MSTADIIRELAIPVVMISANGLLCLALYNRLAAITARLRVFWRERFDIELRLIAEDDDHPSDAQTRALLHQRMATLDDQCNSVARRAWYVRSALVLFLAAVIGMLVVTLLLGLLYAWPAVEPVVLVAFVVSVLMEMTGVALAIGELLLCLEPVKAEGLEMKVSAAMIEARRRPKRRSARRGRRASRRPLDA